ncbi:MAG TPA: ATP-binding cassette domain-containing protein, partial [Chryseolinea sp.]|nr:ATP-binding cassette domain-containing protein [Chryseolinea sp.]
MSTCAVQLDNLSKQYRHSAKRAVSGLTFEIPEGSVFGLLGPNGAGKSTTVMMLCGLMRPDAGSISVFGMDVLENGIDVRKQIGVAPQEIALFPMLTAYE